MKRKHLGIMGVVLLALGCAAADQAPAAGTPTPVTATVPDEAQASSANARVKRSTRGFCHQPGGKDYGSTTKFEPFLTMQACLASGGTLPAASGRKSPERSVIRMSRNKVCHSPASPNYDQLKDYLTFESMKACIDAGGREYK